MPQLSSTLQAHVARDNFYQILDEVGNKFRQFSISLRGQTKAVIMSSEEYEGWLETLDIMSNPQLVKNIKASLKSKKHYTWEESKKKLGW